MPTNNESSEIRTPSSGERGLVRGDPAPELRLSRDSTLPLNAGVSGPALERQPNERDRAGCSASVTAGYEHAFDSLGSTGTGVLRFLPKPAARWSYPSAARDWRACERCHQAIEADDREALLGRMMGAPVPRTLPDRYAPQFRERARELHEKFWSTELGAALPL